jgi:NAD(P)-dependent dehydrogenase (short-subunit alcohol dehydrogenase family)
MAEPRSTGLEQSIREDRNRGRPLAAIDEMQADRMARHGKEMPMERLICLITGATEGVGKATALGLARKGFVVVLGARNAAKAEAVKAEIAASSGNPNIDYLIADLASLKQVRDLADTFKQRYPRLDVLINNAGIFAPERILTEDGFETTLQVNHLSHFYLTLLLLDHLGKSVQGRIINLSSSVYIAGKFDVNDLQSETRFSTFSAYSDSKLLMLLFTIELAERLRETGITANAVHPGVVRTPLMLQAPGIFRLVAYLALPFALSPQKGAATSVYLASAPEVKSISGRYFTSSRASRFKTAFNTPDQRNLLWELSRKSLPLEPFIPMAR